MVLIKVEQSNSETLFALIEKFVLKETKIVVTDYWRAKNLLIEKGFHHQKENHSLNFVF